MTPDTRSIQKEVNKDPKLHIQNSRTLQDFLAEVKAYEAPMFCHLEKIAG